jgi:hypothetical protein
MDYLKSAIENLRGEPQARELKYAVLHLQAATEVLLKVRLIREHWALVFRDPDKATRRGFISGDFNSIGLDESIARLKGIADIELPKATHDSFRRLSKVRNKLQHFGLEENAIGIEALAGEVLDGLLCFIDDHLRPGANTQEQVALDEIQDLIREEMDRIGGLVAARESRIKSILDSNADMVVECPGCLRFSLLIGDSPECKFCSRTWSSADAAEDYAAGILGLDWRDYYADGDPPPVRRCPDCGFDTFVNNVTVRAQPADSGWLCFSCGFHSSSSRIDDCSHCGEPKVISEETGTLCNDCWRELSEGC